LLRVSPRELERLMRRMGVKVTEIECEEVIFVLPDKRLVLKEPRGRGMGARCPVLPPRASPGAGRPPLPLWRRPT